jgi:hypothetical protein
VTARVPALTVVMPVYVLAPDKVNVPDPALVKVAPVPLTTPVILLDAEFVTDKAALLPSPILEAVKAPVVTVSHDKADVEPTAPVNVILPVPAAIVKL